MLFFSYSYQVTETRRGRIVDETGRPVKGAFVMMTIALHDFLGPRVVRRTVAQTDASGAFETTLHWTAEIGGEPGRFLRYHVDLEACHPDYVPVKRERSVDPRLAGCRGLPATLMGRPS